MVRAPHTAISCCDIMFGRGPVVRSHENNIKNINALAFYSYIWWNLVFSPSLMIDRCLCLVPEAGHRIPSRVISDGEKASRLSIRSFYVSEDGMDDLQKCDVIADKLSKDAPQAPSAPIPWHARTSRGGFSCCRSCGTWCMDVASIHRHQAQYCTSYRESERTLAAQRLRSGSTGIAPTNTPTPSTSVPCSFSWCCGVGAWMGC